jgi:hypothetical protein
MFQLILNRKFIRQKFTYTDFATKNYSFEGLQIEVFTQCSVVVGYHRFGRPSDHDLNLHSREILKSCNYCYQLLNRLETYFIAILILRAYFCLYILSKLP